MLEHKPVLAYFITYHTYGTWLHGDEAGSMDRTHNLPGSPLLPPDPVRETQARARMKQPPYTLDAARREVVLNTILEVCTHRAWLLYAVHVRSTHVHVVLYAAATPEKVMTDFKAYASRRLTEAGFEDRDRYRWTEHGSTRYLWELAQVEAAIHYVIYEQGEPMAFYSRPEPAV